MPVLDRPIGLLRRIARVAYVHPMGRYFVADGVSWRRLDDEIVVLSTDPPCYFTVCGAGVLLWEQLAADGSEIQDLVHVIVDSYGLPSADAKVDVEEFLGQCVEAAVVVCSS